MCRSLLLRYRSVRLLAVVLLGLPPKAYAAGPGPFDGNLLGLLALMVAVAGFFALPTGIVYLLYRIRDKYTKR
ncbi:hypothetical protein [Hymenobacter coccineus]|uniref:hypothetical protein n=1 Tax=Hymenobacter coccineus TaxID=1908235 RepID=UPI000F7B9FF8|nr:hypothetical protein [Hymenobacter coccineus]